MTRALFFGDTPHRMAGAQRSLLAGVVAARQLGLDPRMVFPSDGAFPDACRAASLPVRIVEGSAAYRSFGQALLRVGAAGQARIALTELLPYAVTLARVIEAERIDVAHFNTGRGVIMAGMGAHLAGRDVVLHVRGTPGVSSGVWAAAQSLAGRFVLVARALEPYLAPAARLRATVVHNGVLVPVDHDRAAARAGLAKLGIPQAWLRDDVPVVAALSSLVPFKGLHHLMRAVAALRDAGVEMRFALAGVGVEERYQGWLRRLPEQLGVADRVAFLGYVADAPALLGGVDALVLPSVERERLELEGQVMEVFGNEGLPRAVLEAMAAALPVVASDIAGVREQVESGRTGLVVSPGDVPGLTDALARLAREPALRASMGAAGREVVRTRFSVESAGRGLLQVLDEAAKGRSVPERMRQGLEVLVGRRGASQG